MGQIKHNQIAFTVWVGDEEIQAVMPAKMAVCYRCEGAGSHTNPSIDGNGITSSEWAEWGEEEQETYMSGGYDVTCEVCHGANVVPQPNYEAASAQVKKLWRLKQRAEEADAREVASERWLRMAESGERY